jgi:staphylococcal nuclease domain-containing protein 1
MWKDFDAEAEKAAEAAAATEDDTSALKTEYMDVIISDIRTHGSLTFSVQILNTEGTSPPSRLRPHSQWPRHRVAREAHERLLAAPPRRRTRAPRLHAALGRPRVRKVLRRAVVPRPRPARVAREEGGRAHVHRLRQPGHGAVREHPRARPQVPQPAGPGARRTPQVRAARRPARRARADRARSFVQLVPPESEYHGEALERFRQLCEGRKLIANVDHREGGLLHLRLIDPADPAARDDALACVNVELVRDGLAAVDRKGCRYLGAYPAVERRLRDANAEAKKYRAGRFEFGDADEDDA